MSTSMSCSSSSLSSCSTKISDVIEILSVQTVPDDHGWNLPVPVDYEREKQIFTDAVNYCIVLLRQSNRLSRTPSNLLSLEATLLGHEIFESIISINVRKRVQTIDTTINQSTKNPEPQCTNESVTRVPPFEDDEIEIKEELIPVNEPEEIVLLSPPRTTRNSNIARTNVIDETPKSRVEKINDVTNVGPKIPSTAPAASPNAPENDKTIGNDLPPSPLSPSNNNDPVKKTTTKKKKYSSSGRVKCNIPLDVKKRVIELARLHPEWRLKDLREHGTTQLNSLRQLWQWEEQIASGGALQDKYREIGNKTYERFIEARKRSVTVTREMLRDWALDVSRDLYGSRFKFDASPHWLKTFKKSYGLQGNPVTGYYKENERKTTRATKNSQRKRKK